MRWIILKYSALLVLFAFLVNLSLAGQSTSSMVMVTFWATVFFSIGIWVGPKAISIGDGTHLKDELFQRLSEREREVAGLILQNLSNKEICTALHIEHSTLKTHINKIYQKCKTSSRRDFKTKLAVTTL